MFAAYNGDIGTLTRQVKTISLYQKEYTLQKQLYMYSENLVLPKKSTHDDEKNPKTFYHFKRKSKACLTQSGGAQGFVNTMSSSDLSSRLALSCVNMEQSDYNSRTALHIAAAEGDT